MISKVRKLVVVDLDECLCTINTFRYWLLFSYLYLFFSLRWQSFFQFNRIVYQRFRGNIDRIAMKRGILLLTENIPQIFIKIFCSFLTLFVNKALLQSLNRFDGEVDVVLSTAAPICYVRHFVSHFNFTRFFSTPSVFCDTWVENMGTVKLDSIKKHYGDDVVIDTVFTDHFDDLPLLCSATHSILVRPTEETVSRLRGKVKFAILP